MISPFDYQLSDMADAAWSVSQALDIFQSMIELSSSDQVGMSLHPVE
jgi:hypothetical protein